MVPTIKWSTHVPPKAQRRMATDGDGQALPARDFRNAQEEGQWRADDARTPMAKQVHIWSDKHCLQHFLYENKCRKGARDKDEDSNES
jgi:hypothetical protein